MTSEAPPITPGSGLYCYKHEYDHHGPPPPRVYLDISILSTISTIYYQWDNDWEECDKGENYCIEITHTNRQGAILCPAGGCIVIR